MKSTTTTGMICLDGPCGLVYQLGTIACTLYEDESFRYVFTPNWSVIDLLKPPEFQGIPGFDLDMRKDSYERENITPTFIAERAPSENRENLWQMLEAEGMEYLDKIEWLIRTKTRYVGDNLYVRSPSDLKREENAEYAIENIVARAQNTAHAQLSILRILSAGDTLYVRNAEISQESRVVVHDTLRAMLEKSHAQQERKRKEGIRAAAAQGAYAGRKRKALDELVLQETIGMFEEGRLNAQKAAERLDVSQATFFRRLKEYRQSR